MSPWDAAQRLNLDVREVRARARAGELQIIRRGFGRTELVPVASIELFEAARRVGHAD